MIETWLWKNPSLIHNTRDPTSKKNRFYRLDLPDIADPMYKSKPEQDLDVRYEVKEENEFHETRALFIGNLRRPINAAHFQLYLRDLARKKALYNREGMVKQG